VDEFLEAALKWMSGVIPPASAPSASKAQNETEQEKAAHEQIKDYYLSIAGDTPEYPTLEDLKPLIEVVHHACQAGAYDEAWKIYWKRIRQGERRVTIYQLGAYETELALVTEFFPNGNTLQEPAVKDPTAGGSGQRKSKDGSGTRVADERGDGLLLGQGGCGRSAGRNRKAEGSRHKAVGRKHNFLHSAYCLLPSGIGSHTVNVLPFPASLCASMRPPCASTIHLQIASPKPVPPFSRERALSTR